MGAKNHCIVMPDADKNDTINAIVNASMGGSGQRCMAISVAILVGKSKEWSNEIVNKAKTLKVGPGLISSSEVGPVISKESKNRIINIINTSEKTGSKILLDGRNINITEYPNGNWIGPSVIETNDINNIA